MTWFFIVLVIMFLATFLRLILSNNPDYLLITIFGIPVILLASSIYYMHYWSVMSYLYSRWPKRYDTVLILLDNSMRDTGIKFGRAGGSEETFYLGSRMIVVRKGRTRTTVYVGPLLKGNQESIEGLKRLVDEALG